MKFFNNIYKKGVATVQLLDPRSSQQEKLTSAMALRDSVTSFDTKIQNLKTSIAQTSFNVLDPIYGEGAVLEPVTVAVDRDRTLGEEYAPQIDTAKELSKNLALGLGALAVILLVK